MLITFLNGVVMLMLGIVGENLWRIFDAARGRPLYLIDEDSKNSSEQVCCQQRLYPPPFLPLQCVRIPESLSLVH